MTKKIIIRDLTSTKELSAHELRHVAGGYATIVIAAANTICTTLCNKAKTGNSDYKSGQED